MEGSVFVDLILKSGECKVEIFEVGNTYNIAAKIENQMVHVMLSKQSYFDRIKKKQKNIAVGENEGLHCKGTDALDSEDFTQMKDALYKVIDADLTPEEKRLNEIIPNE